MKRRRYIRISIILSMFVVLLLASHMTVLAKTPRIDAVKHKGKGRIKVEFHGKVRYKNVKVTVKDNSGKKYKVKKIKKDSNEIRFTIVKYKERKTYKITISGVKKKGTGKYGKVSGRCTITPKVKSVPRLTSSQAKSIANGYVSFEGVYVAEIYYSNGYYEATLLNANKKRERFIIRIDGQTGAVVYFEYQPTSIKTRNILITIEEVLKNSKAMAIIFEGIKRSILL